MAVNRLTSLLNQKEIVDIFFWQTLGAVLQAALAPEMAALSQESFKLTPTLVLNAAELADAVIRGHMTLEDAQQQARQGGLTEANFQVLIDSAGQPLPALTLMEAARRGFIPWTSNDPNAVSVEQGVRESDTKDKYFPLLQQLQHLLPDPGTVTEARLRGYIKPEEFAKWMAQIGYDDTVAGFIFKAAGVAISPQEGYAAFHRGLIPKDDPNPDTPSLAQIFRESRINDKYLDVWMALQEYIPPPRTVTALLRAGSITEAKARELFKDAGLNADMADAYVADASHQKTQATKELAVGTVVNMYKAKELSRDQALGYITDHGYSPDDAAFLLDYADFQLIEASVNSLVSRVRTYYVGHKISKQQAVDSLSNVGMAADVISGLLTVWDQEANASPVLLTAVQIADAAKEGVLDPNAALDELQGRGYDARDAYIVLLLHKVDLSTVPPPAGIVTKA